MMLRRDAIASLFAAGAWAKPLDEFFAGAHGGAVLLDRKTRRVVLAQMPDLAGPPGSTLKPLVLQTLIDDETRILSAGRYIDTLVRDGDMLKFKSRTCVYDTVLVPNSLIYPL